MIVTVELRVFKERQRDEKSSSFSDSGNRDVLSSSHERTKQRENDKVACIVGGVAYALSISTRLFRNPH